MLTRLLGSSGPRVSALGLGCMGMSDLYGPADEAESIATIHAALDAGINLLDTGDFYGMGHNEMLIRRALAERDRHEVLISVKFGAQRSPAGAFLGVDGRPAAVQSSLAYSLRRLGTDYVDVYRLARVDPKVPIEETVGAMAGLVKAGKVRALGLSEASPDTIRRAHKTHPIAAVQSEYSLLYRKDAEATLATTRALGIAYVAYAPLGRSLLTGSVRQASDIPEGDGRGRHPRFAGDNLARNLALVANVEALAKKKGCTPGQVALAWVLAQGNDIVPIPGTKQTRRVDENLGALDVGLTEEEAKGLSQAIPVGAAAGTRYAEAQMKGVYL